MINNSTMFLCPFSAASCNGARPWYISHRRKRQQSETSMSEQSDTKTLMMIPSHTRKPFSLTSTPRLINFLTCSKSPSSAACQIFFGLSTSFSLDGCGSFRLKNQDMTKAGLWGLETCFFQVTLWATEFLDSTSKPKTCYSLFVWARFPVQTNKGEKSKKCKK